MFSDFCIIKAAVSQNCCLKRWLRQDRTVNTCHGHCRIWEHTRWQQCRIILMSGQFKWTMNIKIS